MSTIKKLRLNKTAIYVLFFASCLILYVIALASNQLNNSDISNGDTLYLPQYVNDIITGKGISSWYTTPATYIFPELFIFAILKLLQFSDVVSLYIFGFLQFVALVFAIKFFLKAYFDEKYTLFISAVIFIFAISSNRPAIFVFYAGHHFAIFYLTLIFSALIKSKKISTHYWLLGLSTLAAISDAMFIIVFSVPYGLYLLYKKEYKKLLLPFFNVIFAVSIKVFDPLNSASPTADKAFSKIRINFTNFIDLLKNYYIQERKFTLLMSALVLIFVIGVLAKKIKINKIFYWFLFISIINVAAAISLNLFVASDTSVSRYIIIPILGILVLVISHFKMLRYENLLAFGFLLLMLGYMQFDPYTINTNQESNKAQEEIYSCIDDKVLDNKKIASTYGEIKPLRSILKNNQFVQVNHDLSLYNWITPKDNSLKGATYVITGYEELVKVASKKYKNASFTKCEQFYILTLE